VVGGAIILAGGGSNSLPDEESLFGQNRLTPPNIRPSGWWSEIEFVTTESVAVESASPPCHDYGFVMPGSHHKADFRLRLPQVKSPIKIKRVRTDCPCLKVAETPEALTPGQDSLLGLVLIAPDARERYEGKVIVQTEDKTLPLIAIEVSADVGMPLRVSPSPLDLGVVPAGREMRATVSLANRGTQAIRPVYATSSKPECIARIPRATVAPKGTLEIPVLLTSSGSGRQRATLTIHTDSDLQPTVEIPIRYEVGIRTSRRPGRGEDSP
jgi:hypothetical protein